MDKALRSRWPLARQEMLSPPYFADKETEAQARREVSLESNPVSSVGILNCSSSHSKWPVNLLEGRKIHIFQCLVSNFSICYPTVHSVDSFKK